MSDLKNDKASYTPGDIQRYLSGQMSAREMHALESAALEDPFLADAIEGFNDRELREITNADADLKELNSRIQIRIGTGDKLTVISFYKRNWLSVAAMILFITGAGIWFFYFSNNSLPDKTLVAKNKLPEQKAGITDSLQITVPVKPGSTSIALNDKTKNLPPGISPEIGKKLKERSSPRVSAPTMQAAPNPSYARSKIANDAVKALTDSGNPASVAREDLITEKKLDNKKSTSITGYGTIKKPDSAATQLNEVVVTRMKQINPGISTSPVIRQESIPVAGLTAYNKYIETNKKVPPDAINVHGNVIVSFIVNEDGTLSDFKIEKSLTAKLDNEAVRLVKEGPAWRAVKNKKTLTSFVVNF